MIDTRDQAEQNLTMNPQPPNQPPPLGRSLPRAEALAKAQGREPYAADHYGPGLLWAGVKRAGAPHARLRAIKLDLARALPGVEAVLTHADVKGGNRQGVVQKDQPVLVDDKVRHAGDAVVLVVAQSRAILAQALELIELDLEPLPPILDPEAALAPSAPLVHENHPTGNLLLEGRLERGDALTALEAAPVRVEIDLELPRQEHAYLETENGWARLEEDGTLAMVVSTQTPFRDCWEMSEALGLDMRRIRLSAPYLGGGFGGKDGVTVQCLLALAALACPGRPVKMWWDREESFLAGCKRHPARVRCRLGSDEQGRLLALWAQATFDTGAYDHLGGVVATLALEHLGGPYQVEHVCLHSRAVYTNNPLSGPFRGFGVPQAAAGVEMALDLLASRLGQDPLQLRLRNLPAEGSPGPAGVSLAGIGGLRRCLEQVEAHPLWQERAAWQEQAPPGVLRGVGVAALLHGMGYGPVIPDRAGAKVELTPEGSFLVYGGVTDMGQGNTSTFLHLAAQALNQPLAAMAPVLPHTGRTLPGGSSSASRTTYTLGNAVLGAAHQLAGQLQAAGARRLGVEPEAVELVPGALRGPGGAELPLAQLAAGLPEAERGVQFIFTAPVSPERPSSDQALQLHGLPHLIYSYACHLAAVEVDQLTGQVRVRDYLAISECGRILNPQLARQQMEGAIVQGLGYALMEDFTCADGLPQTRDLATYIIPTALDAPAMRVEFVPGYEPTGPGGLKGSGELGIDGPLPALGNAVAAACGVRPARYPLTGERVLAALDKKESGHEA